MSSTISLFPYNARRFRGPRRCVLCELMRKTALDDKALPVCNNRGERQAPLAETRERASSNSVRSSAREAGRRGQNRCKKRHLRCSNYPKIPVEFAEKVFFFFTLRSLWNVASRSLFLWDRDKINAPERNKH